jgi:hypothetical protein
MASSLPIHPKPIIYVVHFISPGQEVQRCFNEALESGHTRLRDHLLLLLRETRLAEHICELSFLTLIRGMARGRRLQEH